MQLAIRGDGQIFAVERPGGSICPVHPRMAALRPEPVARLIAAFAAIRLNGPETPNMVFANMTSRMSPELACDQEIVRRMGFPQHGGS